LRLCAALSAAEIEGEKLIGEITTGHEKLELIRKAACGKRTPSLAAPTIALAADHKS
jgi:hypothetical protein